MKKLLLILFCLVSIHSFSQVGLIRPLLGRNGVIYPDTLKSLNVTWPIYGVNDSTIAIKEDTITGTSTSGGNLLLQSTSNATKGKIFFGSTSAYDEANVRLGIGTASPSFLLELNKSTAGAERLRLINSNAGSTAQGLFDISNGTSAIQIGMAGTGFTTSGMTDANTGYVQVSGTTSTLIIKTSHANPIRFGIADVEKMRLSSGGLLALGFTAPITQLHLVDSGANSSRGLTLQENNTSASSSLLLLQKSRGTPNAPTAVTSADFLGVFDFKGYVGGTNTYLTSARIGSQASGTVTDIANGLTANIIFSTRNRIGFAERWRVDTTGNFTNLGADIATAYLHLKSGTTAAGTAPFKLAYQAPALNTTAEKYAMEVDSTTGGGGLYYTSANAIRNKVGLAAYGELYEDGGSTAITVTTAGTYYQWASSTVGSSLLCTNSAATDNITVATGGDGTFLINASISFVGSNSATQKWAVFKNGSRLTNLTSVVHMAGSALQVTTSLTGLVALAATDTIDLRVTSDTNGDIATPAQVNLNITRLSK